MKLLTRFGVRVATFLQRIGHDWTNRFGERLSIHFESASCTRKDFLRITPVHFRFLLSRHGAVGMARAPIPPVIFRKGI